jgi:hypothetical protein
MSYLQQAVALASCEWFSLVHGSATIAELVDVPLIGGVARRLPKARICWPSVFFSKSGDRSGSNLKAIAFHQKSLHPIPLEDYRLEKIA